MFGTLRIPLFILAGCLVVALVGVALPQAFRSSYTSEGPFEMPSATASEPKEQVAHVPTPESVRAIYMTACVAGTPSWRESLKTLIENTELNAVIIDIKDSTGVISIVDENLQPSGSVTSGCKVRDMKEFIASLHESNIYVIGRISVFQDPHYATLHPEIAVKSAASGGVWKDHKGLSFVDVGAEEYWDYIVDISMLSYDTGFDELNFDYIRYPSDGNMKDAHYSFTSSMVVAGTGTGSTTSSQIRSATKAEMLEEFFAYLDEALEDTGAVTSADLFGMVTTVENDLGIGQVLERALPYFDYIAPMVYPSHYPKGWNGFANPAAQPYDVIKIAMTRGVEREYALNIARGNYTVDSKGATTTPPSKLRPWLQDFNLGATYTPDMIRAQIQATYDSGLNSWMLWSAGNKYSESALLPEQKDLTER